MKLEDLSELWISDPHIYIVVDSSAMTEFNSFFEKFPKAKIIMPEKIISEGLGKRKYKKTTTHLESRPEFDRYYRLAKHYIKKTRKYKNGKKAIEDIKEALKKDPKKYEELKINVRGKSTGILQDACDFITTNRKKRSGSINKFPVLPDMKGWKKRHIEKQKKAFKRLRDEFVNKIIERIEKTECITEEDIQVLASAIYAADKYDNSKVKILSRDKHHVQAWKKLPKILKHWKQKIEVLAA